MAGVRCHVLDEQLRQHVVPVLAGVHAVAQFVARLPELAQEPGLLESHGFLWRDVWQAFGIPTHQPGRLMEVRPRSQEGYANAARLSAARAVPLARMPPDARWRENRAHHLPHHPRGPKHEHQACSKDDHQGAQRQACQARGAAPVAHPSPDATGRGRLADRAAPPVRRASRPSNCTTWATSRCSPSSRVHNPASRTRYRVAIRGATLGQQLLQLPRLRHQRPGHLQAHRVHAGPAGRAAWRQGGAGARLPARLQRDLARLRRRAPCALSRRQQTARRRCWRMAEAAVRCGRRLGPAAGTASTACSRCCRPRTRPATSCAATTTSGPSSPRSATASAARPRWPRPTPRARPTRRLGKLLKVKLYPYQAEGALFAARAGRALIGDEMGLGKTIQAIAAAELLARHFGVQPRAGRLPDLAEAPVEERVRTFQPGARRRSSTACARRARSSVPRRHLLQDHQLRNAGARCRPDRRLGARAGDCRRGAAHQELEHHRRARAEAHRQPLRAWC